MSIDSVGFRGGDTLAGNSSFRITLTAKDYFVTQSFPAAAKSFYDSLFPRTGIVPLSYLSVVAGAKATVIDGTLHDAPPATRGADVLNKLEGMETLSAFVSRVELLTGSKKDDANTAAGVAQREDATAAAEQKKDDADVWTRLTKQFNELGTVLKWGAVVVGLVAVAYLVHELKPARR